VNTVGPTAPGVNGVSDLAIVIVVLGAAAFAAAVGLFRFARLGRLAFLTIAGGGSVGVRLVVLRAGLLLPSIGFDWTLVAAFAVAGFAMLLKQRLAVVTAAAASGTFLLGLAVDLVLNKQSGMSRGLRFLLDRQSGHIAVSVGKQLAQTISHFPHRTLPRRPMYRRTRH
jgi:hypothetical protein